MRHSGSPALAAFLFLLTTGSLAPCVPGQSMSPVIPERTGSELSEIQRAAVRRSLARIFCLAVLEEDWSLFPKWALLVRLHSLPYELSPPDPPTTRIRKKQLDGELMITSADLSTDPNLSTNDRRDEWTQEAGNCIVTESRSWRGYSKPGPNGQSTPQARFGSGDEAAADAILAGALAHEALHFDDEYAFQGDQPDCASCAADKRREEVKSTDCELRILRAFLLGRCMTPAELATAAPDINARIETLEKFRRSNQD